MNPAVIVSGAGGSIGPFIIEALQAQRANLSRLAILCSKERAAKFSHWASQGVEIIVGAVTDSASFQGFTVVISLAGNHVLHLQPKMIDAAITAGVKHFYPSEFGYDIDLPALVNTRYYVEKLATREHLRARAREDAGFSFTLVQIGLFAETFALSGAFGVNKAAKTFTWFGSPDTEATLSSMTDTARYTAESILVPVELGQNERKLNVPSGNFRIGDVIEALGGIRGITYATNYRPPQEALDEQERSRQAGDVDQELLASLRWIVGQHEVTVPKPWDNDKFGFQPLGLSQMFEKALSIEEMMRKDLR